MYATINDLYMWFYANKLSLNTGKTKYMYKVLIYEQNLFLNTKKNKSVILSMLSRIENYCFILGNQRSFLACTWTRLKNL